MTTRYELLACYECNLCKNQIKLLGQVIVPPIVCCNCTGTTFTLIYKNKVTTTDESI
jgi:hypothetical protein